MDLSVLTPLLERTKDLEARLAVLEQTEYANYIPLETGSLGTGALSLSAGLGTQNYSYSPTSLTSGLIPASARAIYVRLSALWPAASNITTLQMTPTSNTTDGVDLLVRAILANFTIEQHGIVRLVNGLFWLGAYNAYPTATAASVAFRGYFL